MVENTGSALRSQGASWHHQRSNWEDKALMRGLIGTAGVITVLATFIVVCCAVAKQNAAADRIRVMVDETSRRVDISIDGKPFTVLHLADNARQARALPAARRNRHDRHPRLSPRSTAGRTRRSSASRRSVVQLRQRQRVRLLEQFQRHQARRRPENGQRDSSRDSRRKEWNRSGRARSRMRTG